ncbi:hypothetical protein SLG_16620 [Sphingobium sp. SYK-6]|uniref:hypothetical protein n=1 Tax=Sphingobium sp. (strain NBRC 103272 / SYK-6) TaxID=627192 RepID=UPI0002277078|nr:hypothetical protein [Sphingobium sp. SYK-6]BAK66337.1 hypothetical protein SLG_16620 [Sphingobium sp. SYK-6]
MPNQNLMCHMDVDYNWRWYLIDGDGKTVSISTNSFFKFEDAKKDYELACAVMMQAR